MAVASFTNVSGVIACARAWNAKTKKPARRQVFRGFQRACKRLRDYGYPIRQSKHLHGSQVRPATSEDTAAISRVVIAALRESNSQNYSADIIAQVERSFAPEAVSVLLDKRNVGIWFST